MSKNRKNIINKFDNYVMITNPKTNFSFMIDIDDLELVEDIPWQVNIKGYAKHRDIGLLHRYLMKISKGTNNTIHIDHINGNKLDNRKSNLRFCSNQQNSFNRNIGTTNKSGYKGVSWNKQCNKWHSQITHNYKTINLGYYNNIIDAVKVYNDKALELFGEFAKINDI